VSNSKVPAAAAVEGGAHVRGVPSHTNVTAGERRGKGNYTHGHLVIREQLQTLDTHAIAGQLGHKQAMRADFDLCGAVWSH